MFESLSDRLGGVFEKLRGPRAKARYFKFCREGDILSAGALSNV
ncbi:MAG: hypothetical protein DHS20C05_24030 [Hyphococcus sp.]|nr:MAG: hypothetical protein DHS20C05_24030 [Marinicaulis sp.]